MMPRSKSLTALSLYALTSLTFVFLAMLEFALLLFVTRLHKHSAGKRILPFKTKDGLKTFCYNVDSAALITFIAGFALFNFVYFAIYAMKMH